MPLLNYYSQTKMAKGERFGYKTAILHLAPYKLSGKNVCPNASAACAAACLNTSGRGQMNSVQDARINKTNAFWQDRLQFLKDLDQEIKQLSKRATVSMKTSTITHVTFLSKSLRYLKINIRKHLTYLVTRKLPLLLQVLMLSKFTKQGL